MDTKHTVVELDEMLTEIEKTIRHYVGNEPPIRIHISEPHENKNKEITVRIGAISELSIQFK